MMRPTWLARLLCRWRGHLLVLLNDDADRLECGRLVEVPVVCNRCLELGTATMLGVEL